MRKACLVVDQYQKANKIFEIGVFRDDINAKYIELKNALSLRGYDLATQDINPIENSEIVIYASDRPDRLPAEEDVHKSHFIIWESAFIRPENYDYELHKKFNKVFTWNDDLVDHQKYIKINFSHRFPREIKKDLKIKNKLFILIAGNKKPPHTDVGDLYGERIKAIRWFETNHPEQFDLYGVGWDRHRFSGPKAIRALNRWPWFAKIVQRLRSEQFPSYSGTVSNKRTVMEKYKFSICFENVRGIRGYITEKIFDSFFAGCVPVYLGASNVLDYIPGECFIDMRKFSSYESLYRFVRQLSDEQYLDYLNNIERFLQSEGARPFMAENFGNRICEGILGNHGR